jgi:hypothetical protein
VLDPVPRKTMRGRLKFELMSQIVVLNEGEDVLDKAEYVTSPHAPAAATAGALRDLARPYLMIMIQCKYRGIPTQSIKQSSVPYNTINGTQISHPHGRKLCCRNNVSCDIFNHVSCVSCTSATTHKITTFAFPLTASSFRRS